VEEESGVGCGDNTENGVWDAGMAGVAGVDGGRSCSRHLTDGGS
jgi:hypothetical protein